MALPRVINCYLPPLPLFQNLSGEKFARISAAYYQLLLLLDGGADTKTNLHITKKLYFK